MDIVGLIYYIIQFIVIVEKSYIFIVLRSLTVLIKHLFGIGAEYFSENFDVKNRISNEWLIIIL